MKPGRIGSLIETVKINILAKEHGVPLWCGGMLEGGIANAYNIYTASLSEFSLPADIFPSQKIFYEDIVSPEIAMTADGTIKVPQGLGLGLIVNEDVLNRFTIKN